MMSERPVRELTRAFKALSDSNRLRVIKMLKIRPLCVCEITAILGLATSTVSKHLSILRDAGFIVDEKEGKWVNYRLNTSSEAHYAMQLMSLLGEWLLDDELLKEDANQVMYIDRDDICGG